MKIIPSKSCLVAVAILVTSVTVFAEPEIKGSPNELKSYLVGLPGAVQIVGEGEVKVTADQAIISLRIDSEHKSLAEASKQNQGVRTKLAAFLKEQGIGADRIQPAPFSSTQKTKMFSDKVKSHKVSTLVKVTTHNEQEFQAVTKSVDQFEEVTYVQSEFERSDKDALKTKATEKACDDAERQKRIYEEKLNVKLVTKNIMDQKQVAAPILQRAYAQSEGGQLTAGLRAMGDASPFIKAAASEEETPFGELVFTARVLVEYSVERK